VLFPGPEQVVLLPVFPCPLVVVVWLWVLLPTLVVHEAVPFSLVNVPPDAVHCCSEGEAANPVPDPTVSRHRLANIKTPARRDMRFLHVHFNARQKSTRCSLGPVALLYQASKMKTIRLKESTKTYTRMSSNKLTIIAKLVQMDS
jgi:hypothetical protein